MHRPHLDAGKELEQIIRPPTALRQPSAERKATGEATAELQILALEVVPFKGGRLEITLNFWDSWGVKVR
ncbi:MAG: hypothetical protein NTY25_06840 [Planctomycetia bacterium]|nr:hypothetical protein [Planctomycetia bacterium]